MYEVDDKYLNEIKSMYNNGFVCVRVKGMRVIASGLIAGRDKVVSYPLGFSIYIWT